MHALTQILWAMCLIIGSPALAAGVSDTSVSAPTLIHLLNYVAKDYAGAVSATGEILSVSEFSEQREFLQTAMNLAKGIPLVAADAETTHGLASLSGAVEHHAPPARVESQARALAVRIASLTGVMQAPSHWPQLQQARPLYAQHCARCHGETGNGDGPLAADLDPPPANFLDRGRMAKLSPFDALNSIRLGVSRTSMPAHAELSDDEAWALAFYVRSLAYPHPAPSSVSDSVDFTQWLEPVASGNDAQLASALSDLTQPEQEKMIALLRTHSEEPEAQASPTRSSERFLSVARVELERARNDFTRGQWDGAQSHALAAYLDGVEPVEAPLRAVDPKLLEDVEAAMAQVRQAASSRQSELTKSALNKAELAINAAQAALSMRPLSSLMAFFAGFLILLREGFESVLVIWALLAALRAGLAPARALRWVHAGWMGALGLGVITWFFSGWLLKLTGAQRETLEGVTALGSVAVLMYIGLWLHRHAEVGRWKQFLQKQVFSSLAENKLRALGAISFVAVFREAFETVLFLRAVWVGCTTSSSRAGLGAGVLCALALVLSASWFASRFSRKLPLRRLFSASSAMMLALAVVLTGKGVHALQESGVLQMHWLRFNLRLDLMGVYPTQQTLLAQALVLATAVLLWAWGRRPSASAPRAAPGPAHDHQPVKK